MKALKSFFSTKVILGLVLAVAAFTRLYNIPDTLLFQGDQGRDAMIVADIFREKDLVFIGPVTSVGNMYLGPLYYYFMLPWLWLTYPSPLGPAYAVAILGVITVWLLVRWGRELVGERAALFGAGLMAITAVVITYTRFSWNPNPAPLVSLGMIYATYLAWKKDERWWLVVMACFAILLQLHYLAMLSAGGAGLIWLWSLYENIKTNNWWPQLKISLLAVVILLSSFTPLVLFDSKHDWLNANAFHRLIFEERNFKNKSGGSLDQKIAQTTKETHGRAMHILLEISIGQNRVLNTALVAGILLLLVWLIFFDKDNPHQAGQMVIGAYLLTGIIGTSLYEHTIFDHYIAYLFPVTFLCYGMVLDWLWEKRMAGKVLVGVAVAGFAWYNLPRIPLQDAGWTIADMERVSQEIATHVDPDKSYNITLLSESRDHYGQNYRYYLTTTDHSPVKPGETDVEQLVIINEIGEENPLDSNIYDIVVFPNKEPQKIIQLENGPELIFLSQDTSGE